MRLDLMTHARAALAASLALALAGCAVGPDYRRPDVTQSMRYTESALPAVTASAPVHGGEAQRWVASMDIPGRWWTLFHSARLDALVEDALRRNADVEAAHEALKAAWENVYAQRGAYFPQVDGGYDAARQAVARDVASSAQSGASLYSLTTAQVSVSYAPDLWGGTRRQVESLAAVADAQRLQLEATYLSLTSNLVNTAINEASLRAQVQAARDAVDAQSAILSTLQRQRALGDVADAAVAAQAAALEQSRAMVPPLEKQLAQQRDLLAALSGRAPDADLGEDFSLDELHLPTELPLSLPARLVEQRPDVRAAEEQLHAASAEVGVAIAARLPNVQITASFGRAAARSGALFDAGSGFWNLGAAIAQPLFDGGSLKHKQRSAEAGYRQAAAQYRGVAIAAMQNVADVLHAIQADADALRAAQRAESAAALSLQIARRQLALGDVAERDVLDAQLVWQQARMALAQAQASRYSDTVALFQALGGGWWHRDDAQASSSDLSN